MFELLVIVAIFAIIWLTLVSLFLVYAIMQLEVLYKSKDLKEYEAFIDKPKPKKTPIHEPDLVEVEL